MINGLCSPTAEAEDLKSFKCGFESHHRHMDIVKRLELLVDEIVQTETYDTVPEILMHWDNFRKRIDIIQANPVTYRHDTFKPIRDVKVKAIEITEKNIDFLASRFGIPNLDKEDRLPIGYILVTDFGNDETFDVITKQRFGTYFNLTNEQLDNGFVGAVLK